MNVKIFFLTKLFKAINIDRRHKNSFVIKFKNKGNIVTKFFYSGWFAAKWIMSNNDFEIITSLGTYKIGWGDIR